MKDILPSVLAPLSGIAFLGGLAIAVFIWLSPSGGGMFVGLGTALGWLALGAGNLLSWLLNLTWWLSTGRPAELGWVVGAQSVLVAATLVALAVKW
jgi:hypothetical protein